MQSASIILPLVITVAALAITNLYSMAQTRRLARELAWRDWMDAERRALEQRRLASSAQRTRVEVLTADENERRRRERREVDPAAEVPSIGGPDTERSTPCEGT